MQREYPNDNPSALILLVRLQQYRHVGQRCERFVQTLFEILFSKCVQSERNNKIIKTPFFLATASPSPANTAGCPCALQRRTHCYCPNRSEKRNRSIRDQLQLRNVAELECRTQPCCHRFCHP